MTTAHLVHGFNVRDQGMNTTDRLRPYINDAGMNVCDHDYGWMGLVGVRIFNKRIAEEIANCARKGDIGIGHSNGCTILSLAADAGAALTGLILINPALPPERAFAPQLEWIHVYYSSGDTAVQAARALQVLPWNWSVWGAKPQWGNMGATGYRGEDPRVCSFLTGEHRHSDIFKKLPTWGPTMMANARLGRAVT